MKRTPLRRTGFIRTLPHEVRAAKKAARVIKAKALGHVSREAALEKRLDTLWPQAVKAVADNECEVKGLMESSCGGRLEAHHIVRRRHHTGLKHDLRNLVFLCRNCHSYMEAHRASEKALMPLIVGQARWDWLHSAEANNLHFDRSETEAELRRQLAELKGGAK